MLITDTFRPWAFFIGGMFGGAAFGLAFRDWKGAAIMASVGLVGFSAGKEIATFSHPLFFGTLLDSQQA